MPKPYLEAYLEDCWREVWFNFPYIMVELHMTFGKVSQKNENEKIILFVNKRFKGHNPHPIDINNYHKRIHQYYN
jgi:hypothetical protein